MDWKKLAEEEYKRIIEQRKKGIPRIFNIIQHERIELGNREEKKYSTFAGSLDRSGWNRSLQYKSKYDT